MISALPLLCFLILSFSLFSQENPQEHIVSPLVPTSTDKIFDSNRLRPELIGKVIDTMPQQIIDVIFTLNNSSLRSNAKPKRLLLVGPPGAGKTTMAQVIAVASQRQCKVIEAPFLLNEYKNSGPQNLYRVIMPMLESGHPCVIIVDEITHLTKQHDKKRDPDPGTAIALWLLLDRCAEYDNVLFVGTCNDIDDFPEQLRSRFGESGIVYVSLPDLQVRKEIIYHYLNGTKHSCDDRYVTYLARQLSGKSARDIQDFMLYGIRLAYIAPSINYVVEPKHFDAIIKTWQPAWYPQKIYQKVKPYIKPFWRDVLPNLLQIISLYLNYCTYRQAATQFAWNVDNAKKQLWLQGIGIFLQSKAFDHQVATSSEQLAAQYAGIALQERSLNTQKDALKHNIMQYKTQLAVFDHQKITASKQESMQEKSFEHQKRTAAEQMRQQIEGYKLQLASFEHQRKIAAEQKIATQKQIDMQIDSLAVQLASFNAQSKACIWNTYTLDQLRTMLQKNIVKQQTNSSNNGLRSAAQTTINAATAIAPVAAAIITGGTVG